MQVKLLIRDQKCLLVLGLRAACAGLWAVWLYREHKGPKGLISMLRDSKRIKFGQEPMAEPTVVVVAGWDCIMSFWFVVKKKVTSNGNDLGVKEDKKPGCKGELEFNWMEMLRLILRLKHQSWLSKQWSERFEEEKKLK